MGNLCSSGVPDDYAKPVSAPRILTPQEVIDQVMADAKKEREKNKNIDCNDRYKVSKLVGHGAFAKVMVCSHKETHEKFAVKTVQKNLEDPLKQREGGFFTTLLCVVASSK
jgi:calcium-dependent protein kinase